MKNILAGDKKKEYASLFGLLYCSIILGTHYIVTKQVSASVDAPTLTAYRFLIAALPLFGYLIYKKKDPFANFKPGAILGFFLWLVFIMISLGLEHTSATNTGFISGIFFVFVPFVDYLIFKKRLQLFNLPIITLSLGGLYLLTGGLTHLSMAAFFAYWLGGEKFSGLQLTGGLLLFVSAIIYSIFAKKN